MRHLIAIGTAATLLFTGCSSDSAGNGDRPDERIPDVQLIAALTPFDACDEYLEWVIDAAGEQVGPYGLGGDGVVMLEDSDVVAAEAGADGAGDGASGPATRSSEGYDDADTTGTGTNNQETAVDEADLVKTDGSRIVAVQNDRLTVTTVVDGAPYHGSALPLGENSYATELFLVGDTAYVLGESWGTGGVERQITSEFQGGSTATVWEVELTGTPRVVDVRHLDGRISDGRMSNGAIHLVLSTTQPSGLDFVYPQGPNGEQVAEDANRSVIENSSIEDWIPSVSTGGGGPEPLLACDDIYRPAEFSGFDMLSVLTIRDGLDSLRASGVVSNGGIAYASAESLYVATTSWTGQRWFGGGMTIEDGVAAPDEESAASADHTDVHRFALDGEAGAAYASSGRVAGQPLNQYSMSEADGHLRIATTVTSWCGPGADCAGPGTESRVTVLTESGEGLTEVGMVDGLGPTETIRSVRYVGDLAYVVTFRQTDPFYVVDLSDPASPRTLGELKVPGFSSYLHPVGDGLVLGVGSDATDDGRITGAKVSMYDASDPAAPRELATWTAADIEFMVGNDTHAFHWDEERRQAVLPYYGTCFTGACRFDGGVANGALVMAVGSDSLTELARLDHRNTTPSPEPTPDAPTTTTTSTTTTSTAPPTTSTPTTTTTPATTTTAATSTTTTTPADSSAPIPVDPGIGGPILEPLPSEPIAAVPTILRAFVLDGSIFTISDVGVAAHDASSFAFIGFARY